MDSAVNVSAIDRSNRAARCFIQCFENDGWGQQFRQNDGLCTLRRWIDQDQWHPDTTMFLQLLGNPPILESVVPPHGKAADRLQFFFD